MRHRLPLILSATALAVALLGSTPLGQAASSAIAKAVPLAKVALFSNNAGKLNGHSSSTAPRAGQIPVLNSTGKLPASIVPSAVGSTSTGATGQTGVTGATGSAGPTGATGPAGATTVVQRFGTSVVVAAGASGTAFASCNAGEHVVGGGFFAQAPGIETSRPSPLSNGAPATAWQATLLNSTGGNQSVGAYVMCSSP